jgi:hypothetical protein
MAPPRRIGEVPGRGVQALAPDASPVAGLAVTQGAMFQKQTAAPVSRALRRQPLLGYREITVRGREIGIPVTAAR